MVKLKDKEGNIVEFPHAVDAREAIMSGNFFDITGEKAPEPSAEKEEVVKEGKKKKSEDSENKE